MTLIKPDFQRIFPERSDHAHKGDVGRVGVVAGSLTMLGAAILTARSALRSGAGLVYLFTVNDAVPMVNTLYPELIVVPLPTQDGGLADLAVDIILSHVSIYHLDVLAIGPGLGQNRDTQFAVRDIVKRVCEEHEIPIVLDADGLNAVTATFLSALPDERLILTPHPGEFYRLFSRTPTDEDGRRASAKAASLDSGQIVVLKGQHTLVSKGHDIYVNQTGNSGMATAGAGDVLTGVVASLLGQNMTLFDAACLGVYAHGMAGDLAYDEAGIGLLASDILAWLPAALMEIKGDDD